ncbi:methyl-accepting chemotaxis protein [Clostridium drakei]|uniref:methyl-accepting chemotaxis protein n=1 Tax=Clostridium drakei TaxID=332101 RepID=UPI0005098A82|nr:methyl-accepting chemotaxis protein [Clostridium drakei]
MSIKRKLPLIISLLVCIPLALSSAIAYFYSSTMMQENGKKQIDSSMMIISDNIYSLIDDQKKEVELLAKSKEIIEISKVRQHNVEESFFSIYSTDPANILLKKRFEKESNHEHLFLLDTSGIICADSDPKSLKFDLKERTYFREAMQGKLSISNTLISKINGKPIIVFAAPVVDENGKVISVVANSVYVEYFTKHLSSMKFGKTGYAYMVDSDGVMLSNPNRDKIAKPVENEIIKEIASKVKKGDKVEKSVTQYSSNSIKQIEEYNVISGVNWTIVINQELNDLNESARTLRDFILVMLIIFVVISVAIGIFFSRGITKPIIKLLSLMDKASKGDLSIKSKINRKDEIGKLSNNFNIMIENIKNVIGAVKKSSENISLQSDKLALVSKEMASSSENVATSIQSVANGTGDQTENLIEITNMLNDFGNELDSIVKAINDVTLNSRDVNILASESNEKMKPLITSVNEISKSFNDFNLKIVELHSDIKQINEITELINNIADQTNLLALNAAIEAARAGEAGGGFSVVAEEVRKLAEQSKVSSENISTLINNISSRVETMTNSTVVMNKELESQVSIIQVAMDSFNKIISAIEGMNPKIEAVSVSSTNINKEKNDVLGKLEGVSAISEEISASAQEIAASAEEMSASNGEVASMAQSFSDNTKDMETKIEKIKT